MHVGKTMGIRVGAALLGALVTTGSHAQEPESAHRPTAGVHTPVIHREVCPGPAAPGTARCHAHVVVDASGKPLTTGTAVTPAGYSPQNLRSAYGMANVAAFRSTPVIAIVDAYDYPNAASDLAVYRAQYGLPALPACPSTGPCFEKVNQVGSTPYPSADTSGWSQEAALDLDMASAMCPGCTLILVEANSADDGDLGTAANTAAVTMRANVVNNSYGGGESGTASYAGYYQHPGVAFTASAGDNGYGVQFPASSPYVTAVGGTTLTEAGNARGWTETVWNDSYGATSSGCSAVYPQQKWQSAVLSSKQKAGCSRRIVADVSAVADPATGVAIYGPTRPNSDGKPNPSGWMVFGGTSAAAPLIAGIYAVNFGVTGNAPSYGSNPYAHAGNAGDFNDVTSGTDGKRSSSCGSSTSSTYYLCDATTGYDAPSGLGTPKGYTAF